MKISLQLLLTETDRLVKSAFNPEWFTNRQTVQAFQGEVLRIWCLVVICVNFLIGFLGSWVSYQFYGIVTLLALCVLLLNKRGKYKAARLLFMGFVHLIIFLLCDSQADLLLTYSTLVVGVLVCYLLFFEESQWKLIVHILLMLALFTFFQVTQFSLLSQVAVTDQLLNRAFMLNIGCILASVVLSLMYLVVVYEKSEKNLRRTLVELKHRNQEMDQYVYRVSHDLRAPLCSVTGLVNLAREEDDPEALQEYLTMINNTIQKSDNFIQSVLTHSMVMNKELKPARVELDRLIRTCFNELREMRNWHRMQLEINLEASSLFCSDAFRLSTVFHNLLQNAVHYQKPGSEISLIQCRILIDSRQAVVELEDQGTGIEPESIRRIFDMFYRGTEKSEGAGLGLYIVKQTLDSIGGTIAVESQPEQGATFTLKLENMLPGRKVETEKQRVR